MTTPDVLPAILDHVATGPDRPAAKDLERDLNYRELGDDAALVAAGLGLRGVKEGDRVALLLPNSVDFVVAALACLWIGAIFVPLAVTDPVARLETILGDCAPAVVITSDDRADGTGEVPVPDRARLVGISELRAPAGDLAAPDRVSTRVAYAIYTSGTTGTPKGVLIGNRAFAAAVAASARALDLGVDTRTLCVSPFHFDGSFGTLFPTLFSGGAIVIRPREALLFPRTFFNTVKNEAITYTGFSPSYLRLLLSSPQVDRLAGTALEVVALGGEACSAERRPRAVGCRSRGQGHQPLRSHRDDHRRDPRQGHAGDRSPTGPCRSDSPILMCRSTLSTRRGVSSSPQAVSASCTSVGTS